MRLKLYFILIIRIFLLIIFILILHGSAERFFLKNINYKKIIIYIFFKTII
jgi:hypothetical protein